MEAWGCVSQADLLVSLLLAHEVGRVLLWKHSNPPGATRKCGVKLVKWCCQLLQMMSCLFFLSPLKFRCNFTSAASISGAHSREWPQGNTPSAAPASTLLKEQVHKYNKSGGGNVQRNWEWKRSSALQLWPLHSGSAISSQTCHTGKGRRQDRSV